MISVNAQFVTPHVLIATCQALRVQAVTVGTCCMKVIATKQHTVPMVTLSQLITHALHANSHALLANLYRQTALVV